MASKTNGCLENPGSIEPLPSAVVVVHLYDARNHEPDVICQVPGLMDAIVFLTPWPNIIEHENMKSKIFSATMTLFILIKHRTVSTNSAHEKPKEQYHKDVEWN